MTAPIKAATIEELRAAGAPQLFTQTAEQWKVILTDWWETGEDGPQRTLYPAQTEAFLIDMLSYGFALLGQEAQAASEQRWLAFATGAHVDVLAANNSTFRLKAQSASTTLRFTIQAGRVGTTIVPAGTRVAAGDLAFATDADCLIAQGDLIGDVTATATEAGLRHNGLAPDQIDQLLDPLAFVAAVVNTTESAGGSEAEADERLADRAADAHNRISKAGGRAAYQATVRGFSPTIIDVAVIRPEPGHIHIYPLVDEGNGAAVPAAQFRSDLLAYLDPVDTRPQGDDVVVLAPTDVSLTAEATITAVGHLAAIETTCRTAIAAVGAALERQLGAYVSSAAFTCALKAIDGVIDAEIAFPGLADRQLDEAAFAQLTAINITMIEGQADG